MSLSIKTLAKNLKIRGLRISSFFEYLQDLCFRYPQGVMLLLLFCFFSFIARPWFLSPRNLINVLRQASLLYILVLGQTLVILTRGIDLSIGGVLSVSSCVAAIYLKRKLPMAVGITVGLGIGAIFGSINGMIVATTKLHPFIVTYAMMWISKGLGYIVTKGSVIYPFSSRFRFLGAGEILNIPTPIIWAGLIFLLFYFLLSYTRNGRAHYGVGSNPDAARLMGINVPRTLILAYGLSGLLASAGGILYISRLNSAEAAIGELFLLETIAAVIIGGTPFTGGEGGIGRSFIGVLIITIIINGMNISGVSTFWQNFALGTIIIIGTLINEYVRRITYLKKTFPF